MSTVDEVVSSMVEMDAHEFGLHLKEGGWRLGLLVARCVEPGEGGGANFKPRDERPELYEGEKISATRYADMAGTSNHRIMRYYQAWERAAAKGKVPAASELSPGEEPNIDWDRLPRWKSFFSPGFDAGGATGPLNLTIKLGQFGDRLLKTHKRLVYFVEREMADARAPSKPTRELAGRYAACLEEDARVLRLIESGKTVESVAPATSFGVGR